MRKILLPFAMMAATAFATIACDVEGEGDDTTTTNNPDTNDTGSDTVEAPAQKSSSIS